MLMQPTSEWGPKSEADKTGAPLYIDSKVPLAEIITGNISHFTF